MALEDKVSIITGAGSGIGRATALRFAAEGAILVLNDVNQATLDEVASQARSRAAANKLVTVAGDVSKESTAKQLAGEALDKFARIDVLVNNAGIHHLGDITETSLEEWNRVITINLTSMFLCSRAVIPSMLKQRSGAIVNLASISSFIGQEMADKSTFLYNVTKAGALQLTKSLATRYATDGIRVNCVCPGATRTNQLRSSIFPQPDPREDEFFAMAAQGHPMKRVGRPEEIAAVIAFLASDDASFMTGAAVSVDGGYLAQ
jgi:NAD(P)-dependent dehydrogenase (short-subunit alcohol dehydrogenase family)